MKFHSVFSCFAMLSTVASAALVLQHRPAEARPQGGGSSFAGPIRPGVPVVRDHRPQPVVRDHRAGVRDHRDGTASSGGVKVGNGRVRKVDCLGNLC